MKISYAITVCNELQEIQRLLDFLIKHKQENDEIVVLLDTTKADDEMISTLQHYERYYDNHINIFQDKFQGHFADWKNQLTLYCFGDYIFQIDADEVPNENLIAVLPEVLEENNEVDVFLVPRVNTVEGLTPEHIAKWGWRVNDAGWVNWPDYQWRIWRNKPEIQWVNKVHERLDGFKQYTAMPDVEYFALYHPKTIERQEKQNNYYDTL
jgi:glycosyltransferase involved in cell wall biosynthesis